MGDGEKKKWMVVVMMVTWVVSGGEKIHDTQEIALLPCYVGE